MALAAATLPLDILDRTNKYASRIRLGDNGKLYFPVGNNNAFLGNQYVSTRALANYTSAFKYTSTGLSIASDLSQLGSAIAADNISFGYATKRQSAMIIGRRIGEGFGMWLGRVVGSASGLGVASVPLGYTVGIVG